MSSVLKCLGMSLAFVGLTIGEAHAYVDPGSGSVIVTTILGLVAAVGYTFRKYFYQLKRKLSSSKSPDHDSDLDDEDVDR